ncbi:hypothetical protein [Hoeflea poritis]|uniref:Uncharacterized protein n=1 Tax=Hoeflea poritis TaxID=2993659 RepID=A0ABT4VMP9_9HYPH|nr:hypothetical protein [Hoeflea poritis]MDA4845967.1 hypothetical protein [Hoeflea poritis]
MTKPGRIPCINPKCGRTGPDDGSCSQICCGKCWKLLPVHLTRRYKKLRRLLRSCERRYAKIDNHTNRIDVIRCEKLCDANWRRIWKYFNRPEQPEGLDRFLEEQGMS